MNILVNISNLRFGGGVTVAQQLLNAWLPAQKEHKVFIIHPHGCSYEQLGEHPQVHLIPVPGVFHRLMPVKMYYNRIVFPALVKKLGIDRVVSLGNVAFPSGKVPQLLLIQIAWLLYPESEAWKQIDFVSRLKNQLMCAYIRSNLKYATQYALQTPAMRTRFISRFSVAAEKVHLLPNAPAVSNETTVSPPDFAENELRLLMLSRYYPYKNFKILIPLAKILKEKRLPVKIFITLDENETAEAGTFLRAIENEQLHNQITNIGHLKHSAIPAAFSAVHASFLPTFIESFSGVYAESMFYGRPVFTSNLDFATSLCGDAGIYFDPTDAHNIAKVLEQALENRQLLKDKAMKSIEIARSMEVWQQIAQRMDDILENM